MTRSALLGVRPTLDPEVRRRYGAAHRRGAAMARLCRLQISRVPCLVFLVTAVAAGRPPRQLAGGALLICSMTTIGATLNDLADVASDRANGRRDRPLASGALTTADVRHVLVGAVLLTAASQLLLPQPTGALVAIAAGVVGWASACKPVSLQSRGLVGLLVLGLAYLVLPVWLATADPVASRALPLALIGAGALAHKDVRDEHGDRVGGKRTLLVAHGYRTMAAVAVATALLGVLGLVATIGTGAWIVPAALAVAGLAAMAADDHRPSSWLAVRIAVVATACLVGSTLGQMA